MIKKIQPSAFFILITCAFLLRLWYILLPSQIWWDTAIYFGMGKYIFTHGVLGIWEPFRPLVWPVILGFFWKIGAPTLFLGKIIELLSSVGILYLVYRLGEKIRKDCGLVAAFILSFTPVFYYFTPVQITDLPSTYLALLSFSLLFSEKYFIAGIIAGLGFATRFPQALIFIPAIISLGVSWIHTKHPHWLKKIVTYSLGYAIIIIPSLILNKILYGSITEPFKLGTEVLKNDLWQFDHGYLFYITATLIENPLYIACFGLLPLIYKKPTLLKSRMFIGVVSAAAVFFAYLTYERHKELRYSIMFLPYLSLLAAYPIAWAYERVHWLHKRYALYWKIIPVTIILTFIFASYTPHDPLLSVQEKNYLHFFDTYPGSSIYTSSPQHAVYSDVAIIRSYDTLEDAITIYTHLEGDRPDFAAINTCDLECHGDENYCSTTRSNFVAKVMQDHLPILDTTENSCRYIIVRR